MGALKGSIAVRRYVVLDPLPQKARERLTKGARAHAFLPLDPKSDVDRAVGWVSIEAQDDAELAQEKLFFVAPGGEQLRVALRVDVLKPPRSEIRRQTDARAAEMAAEGRELSRRERRTLQEEVTRTLRLRAFPRVRVTDMVWNLDSGKLWFWSQAKSANEAMVDLFVKSFGLRIEVDGPSRWAAAAVEDERVLGRLEPTRELWLGFDGLRPLGVPADEEAA